ncbi:hypothetical protein CHS0354_038807 [Potamilus streckersoni]|uniref:Claudin n=1 Tax=Potamilus streckersoni TaxID=2493646 RepID=A0AAE0WDG6_9BIVA|nr:hypothetical protein CHS0354_038807 [Potamilus streckersoni]
MTFCGDASSWAKVSFLLVITALGLHTTGFATNAWMTRTTVRDKYNFMIGLWKMTNCSGYYQAPCEDTSFPGSYYSNLVIMTRAFASSALIIVFVTCAMTGFYVGSERARTRGLAITIIVVDFVGAAFAVAGIVAWIISLPAWHYPNWSMGLVVLALVLVIIAGVLLIPDVREYDYRDRLLVKPFVKTQRITSKGLQPIVANTKFQMNDGRDKFSKLYHYDRDMGNTPDVPRISDNLPHK